MWNSRRGREYEHVCLPALRQVAGHLWPRRRAKTALAYGVPVLGEVEIDPRIRIGGTPASHGGAWRKRRRCEESLQRRTCRRRAPGGMARTTGGPRSRSIENLRFFSFGGIVQRFDLGQQTSCGTGTLRRRSASDVWQFRAPAACFLLAGHRGRRTVHNVFPSSDDGAVVRWRPALLVLG